MVTDIWGIVAGVRWLGEGSYPSVSWLKRADLQNVIVICVAAEFIRRTVPYCSSVAWSSIRGAYLQTIVTSCPAPRDEDDIPPTYIDRHR